MSETKKNKNAHVDTQCSAVIMSKKLPYSIEPDLVVVVGGKEFHESSHLLRWSSEYFDAAFRSRMKESQAMRFEFPNEKPQDWELIVSLLVPFPKAQITKENIDIILKWFDKLCVTGGMSECDKFFHHLTKTTEVIRNPNTLKIVLHRLSIGLQFNLATTKATCIKLVTRLLTGDGDWLANEDIDSILDVATQYDECREAFWDTLQAYLPRKVTDRTMQLTLLKSGILTQCIVAKIDLALTKKQANLKTKRILRDFRILVDEVKSDLAQCEDSLESVQGSVASIQGQLSKENCRWTDDVEIELKNGKFRSKRARYLLGDDEADDFEGDVYDEDPDADIYQRCRVLLMEDDDFANV